jgi:hypothetical protein
MTRPAAHERDKRMTQHNTSNFKASALTYDTLRAQAPSIFASGPMQGVRYGKVEVMPR